MRELRAPYLATGAATGVLLPFVAPILAGRGFSPQSIGLLLAITSAAIVVAAPIWGQVGDVVLGRRRTLQWAVLIAAAAFILLAGRLALPLVAAAVAIQYLLQTAFSALLELDRHACSWRRAPPVWAFAAPAEFVLRHRGVAAGVIYDRAGYGVAFSRIAAVVAPKVSRVSSRPRPITEPPALSASDLPFFAPQ